MPTDDPSSISPLNLYRLRSGVKFALLAARNRAAWTRDDLEGARLAHQLRDLTWELIDLEEQIRQVEYH